VISRLAVVRWDFVTRDRTLELPYICS